jgi:hypothetical protein
LFIDHSQLIQNSSAYVRLLTVQENIRIDLNYQGLWIKRASTAHNLAVLLGFQPQNPREKIREY